MKDYSYGDIAKMQLQAVEDARNMSSRSALPDEEKHPPEPSGDCKKCQNKDCEKNPSSSKKKSLFDLDDDKFLLIALILILMKGCDDKTLLLALLYIMM